MRREYVLVTAAFNEEAYIEKTLRSIVKQTLLPSRWVIVSDGCTDDTDKIVSRYAASHHFIQLLSLKKRHKRNFGAQVEALHEGFKELQNIDYRYIGNIDADVSFDSTYFEQLIERFEADADLGLSGGSIYERQDDELRARKRNSVDSVAHAVQLFRRECFEAVGGYVILRYGGPDWHACVTARMLGWKVCTLPDLHVEHHRPAGADRWVNDRFRQGRMDFSVGSHPVFEIAKCLRRVSDRPMFLGAFTRFSGFIWSYCVQAPREVSKEFMTFLRQEQMLRITRIRHTVRKS